MNTDHTPTPWKLSKNNILDSNGDSIAHVNFGDGEIMAFNDAAFIVRAANAHEELLAACKESLDWILAAEVREQLFKAIAKAEAGL